MANSGRKENKIMSKQEISIAQIKIIAKEELQKYVSKSLTEDNLRETIQNQLDKAGKEIVFKHLGLRLDSWSHKWELSGGYGGLNEIIKNHELLINDIGAKVIQEIIKDVTPEDVLASLTKPNIQSLKKVYRETLMDYFVDRVRELAIEHGKEYAEKLFKKYLYEESGVE